MTDLVGIMSKLVDRKGKIQVPGIYDSVDPVTQEERDSYKVFNPFLSYSNSQKKSQIIKHIFRIFLSPLKSIKMILAVISYNLTIKQIF